MLGLDLGRSGKVTVAQEGVEVREGDREGWGFVRTEGGLLKGAGTRRARNRLR